MDSSILGDPRFKLLAADLDINLKEVIGTCFLLWLACYERRSERLQIEEADLAAEFPGFSKALAARGLADVKPDNTVVVHGVRERIKFLKRQRVKGAKGGKNSAAARSSKRQPREANASADAQATDKAEAQAYSLDLSLAPSLAQAQDLEAEQSSAALASVPQGTVATTQDVERLASALGWTVHSGGPRVAKAAAKALARGPLLPELVAAAIAQTREKAPDEPLLYFLGTVAGMREDLERGRGPPKRAGPHLVSKQDQSFAAMNAVTEQFNASRK